MAWYKGNLHMHSYWSDGHDFPEMIAADFKDRGYDFIAFTEHDRHQVGEKWVSRDPATGAGRSMSEGGLLEKYVARFGQTWVEMRGGEQGEVRMRALNEYRHLVEEEGQFLMIIGEEVMTTWGEPHDWGRTHWINVFNTPAAIPPQHDPHSSSAAMASTVRAAGSMSVATGSQVLVFLNHPNCSWNATAENIAAVADLRHVEIYTALNMCQTFGDDRHCSAERIWDVALSLRLSRGGHLIYGMATDDCHAYAPHFEFGDTALPGRAWICVRAEDLTVDQILGSVNRGDFYGSSGVTLEDVELNDTGITLRIEPQEGVRYTTRFIGTPAGVDLSSEPVLDEAGAEVHTTRRYSDQVGQCLAETTDLSPSYQFTGDELYVRAVVSSSVRHPNPTAPGDVERAWTQPARPAP